LEWDRTTALPTVAGFDLITWDTNTYEKISFGSPRAIFHPFTTVNQQSVFNLFFQQSVLIRFQMTDVG
jgi:hypothetical protein